MIAPSQKKCLSDERKFYLLWEMSKTVEIFGSTKPWVRIELFRVPKFGRFGFVGIIYGGVPRWLAEPTAVDFVADSWRALSLPLAFYADI